jgi:hypothetical protein
MEIFKEVCAKPPHTKIPDLNQIWDYKKKITG